MQQTVQQLDPQISTDRIAARKIARDLKLAASQGEPNGWRLYRAFRKAAKLVGLLASAAHFQVGGA
jgi:hypothetical protein